MKLKVITLANKPIVLDVEWTTSISELMKMIYPHSGLPEIFTYKSFLRMCVFQSDDLFDTPVVLELDKCLQDYQQKLEESTKLSLELLKNRKSPNIFALASTNELNPAREKTWLELLKDPLLLELELDESTKSLPKFPILEPSGWGGKLNSWVLDLSLEESHFNKEKFSDAVTNNLGQALENSYPDDTTRNLSQGNDFDPGTESTSIKNLYKPLNRFSFLGQSSSESDEQRDEKCENSLSQSVQ